MTVIQLEEIIKYAEEVGLIYDKGHCIIELDDEEDIVFFHQFLPNENWKHFEISYEEVEKEKSKEK